MTTITFSPFFLLIISICAEVFGTMSLGKSSGFQHIGWGLVALILYGLSFWFLSKVITAMPIAVAYAIWAGLGNVLTVLLAWMLFSQVPPLGTIAGISLIVLGVLVLQFCGVSH